MAKRTPRISAIGVMMLLSPADQGIAWRVEFFSEAGNIQGYITCKTEADARQRRKELFRAHQKLHRERK